MPQKGSVISNVFESLEDLGKSTVKSTAKAVNQTLNPIKIIESLSLTGQEKIDPASEEKLKSGSKQSATPLDFNKLDSSYKQQSVSQLDAVRRQFNLVKSEERRAIDTLQREEDEYAQKIARNDQQKAREKQDAARQQQSDGPSPQGKRPRGMAATHKKKAQEKHQETKPATGKQ